MTPRKEEMHAEFEEFAKSELIPLTVWIAAIAQHVVAVANRQKVA